MFRLPHHTAIKTVKNVLLFRDKLVHMSLEDKGSVLLTCPGVFISSTWNPVSINTGSK